MIDYLYQLDYDFKPLPCNGVIPNDGEESIPILEPVSPVAQVIDAFEDMVAREEEPEYIAPPLRTKKEKKKVKRRVPSSWPTFDELPPQPEPAREPSDDIVLGESKESNLHVHAQMYALADKYGIHDLKDLARDKFAEAASNDWDGSGFPIAVQTVYSSTPESDHGLRDVVVDTLSQHRVLLAKAEVEALVKEINGLAFGLLKFAWGL